MKRAAAGDPPTRLRDSVEQGYARIAQRAAACCGGASPHAYEHGRKVGYSEEELRAAPEGANLGLGCGNPTALASLRAGEVVLDLGSGAGFDAFLAARKVGASGRVIGVDMTEAMLERARENARKGGFGNVEFRKGTIEDLPVDDESVDAVISNCVINLSPEKERVFREAFRVLRPGGRLMVSDLVVEQPLPERVLASVDAYVGCIAGAALRRRYLNGIQKAGFREVTVVGEARFAAALSSGDVQLREVAERLRLEADEVEAALHALTRIHVRALK